MPDSPHPLRQAIPLSLLLPLLLVAFRPASAQVPLADHIIVVVMENHSYDETRYLPYTASLIATSSSFSASFSVTHPSQPNYLAIWSGGTQGVTDDRCPPPGYPFSTENLGHACEAAGISWRSYSESLPAHSYAGCWSPDSLYARKHAPWTNFNNLHSSNERSYGDLATDISTGTLPRLAFVIPNQCHNTHDCAVPIGDAWLAANLPAMIEAVGSSGFVVLTWDEDDDTAGNHILTVFAGGLVQGNFVSRQPLNHYTVLRALCDALGIPPFGAAVNEAPIRDVWVPSAGAPGVEGATGSILGAAHPNPSSSGFEVSVERGVGFHVGAAVFDAAGHRVAEIPVPSGEAGRIRWDGRRADGRPAEGGIYFLRVHADGRSEARRLVLLHASGR